MNDQVTDLDTHPNLLKEFSTSNKRGPETYRKERTYRAALLCTKCGGEYNYPINEREVEDDILDKYSKNVWWICKDCNKRHLMSPKRRFIIKKEKALYDM